jgi:tRNA modification GTPase
VHAAAELHNLHERMKQRGESSRAAAVLVGLPNTGKSSLFNALTGGKALVDAQPGTTRDYLSADVDLGGLSFRLIDTAGRMPDSTLDPLAEAAERMAVREGRSAPVMLLCLDATRPLHDWERQQLGQGFGVHRLVVLTKCDLPRKTDFSGNAVETSAHAGRGLDALLAGLRQAISKTQAAAGDVVTSTADRCRESVDLAAAAIRRAEDIVSSGQGDELLAAELRLALDELGKVVGAVYTDDVLDRIFSRFCIGK